MLPRPTGGVLRTLLEDLSAARSQRKPLPVPPSRTFSSALLPPRSSHSSSSPPSPASSPFARLAPSFPASPSLLRTYASASTSSSTSQEAGASLSAALKAAEANPSDLAARKAVIDAYDTATSFWLADSTVRRQAGALEIVKKDEEAFQAYLKALATVAGSGGNDRATAELFEKLQTARGRREELKKLEPIVVAAEGDAAAKTGAPAFSPPALISGLFGGLSGRGKGGEAKVQSVGSFGSWASSSGSKVGVAGEPIRVIVEEAKSPLAWRVLKFVATTALYSFLLLSLLSLLIDSSGILRAGAQSSNFQATAAPDASDPNGRGTTFKDVHGVEEAKHELFEIVDFLKDPSRYEKLGGRLPRGVLLTGPPGTGKTLLARAVAGEAGVPFFSASGSEFDEMYVGVGARRIRELFAAARKQGSAIIFIDELDAIGGKRSPKDQTFHKQTLNQLLTEMDGFDGKEGIIVIGATNFPESLDKALVRPGRFDRHVAVPLPDVRGRMEILKHHMRNIVHDKAAVDISIIARGTIGFSGADLQALVNQAAVKASADRAEAVRPSHFEWAKERIMMGAARKSAYITAENKLATAYHEAGHALLAIYTKGAYPLQSITVIPRGNALGYTLMLPEMDKQSHSLAEYRAKLDVAMGGRVAEELQYGKDNVTDGASSDISNATSIASNMVRRFGFSDALGPVAHPGGGDSEPPSPETQRLIDAEVKGLIEAAQERARAMLRSKKTELERLAKALVEYETLDSQEVQKVIKGEKLERTGLE